MMGKFLIFLAVLMFASVGVLTAATSEPNCTEYFEEPAP